jgi:hypothetical protein
MWCGLLRTPSNLSTSLQDALGKSTSGNFVVVDVAIENNSSEAKTIHTSSITLLDSQGRESRADPETLRYVDPNQRLVLEQVNPGVVAEGRVIYSVAQGASGFRLSAGDAEAFGQEFGEIELGF